MGKIIERFKHIALIQMLVNYIKIRRGGKVYSDFCRKYGNDIYILICPWNGTGDACQTGRYLGEYLRKNEIGNYILATHYTAVKKVFDLFQPMRVSVISPEEIYALTHLCRFCGDSINVRIIHHNVPLFHTSVMDPVEGINKIDWETCFKEIGLGLDSTCRPQMPAWDTSFDCAAYFLQHGLVRGKTVLLAPEATTFRENLTPGQWELIAERLTLVGYTVCTNLGEPNQTPVLGTVGVFLPYSVLVPFLDYAGAFIAVRSGFCDIAAFSSCKKIILYQPVPCGAGSVYDLFSLVRMGLCADAEELEIDTVAGMVTVNRILQSFNIQGQEVKLMPDDKWLISVIIPIYNTEMYVAETIRSVVMQTIGFEKNIQLILVNNGSTDKSGEICKKYQSVYPNNIVYVELNSNRMKNGGRLAGLEYAEGKYVNFLDSDDIWEKDSFRQAVSVLKEYSDKIDFVACRIRMFEGGDWFDWLDAKATHNYVVNILKRPDKMHLVMGSCLFKRDIFKHVLPRVELTQSEDSTFVCECLLRNPNYGVCTALYRYRVRIAGTSACQTRGESPDWYMPQIILSYQYLMRASEEKYGKVIDYVQHYIIRETFFHFETPLCSMFNERLVQEYVDNLRLILQKVDDKWICWKDSPWEGFSNDMLRLKYVGLKARDVIQNGYSMVKTRIEKIGRSDIETANDAVWLYQNGRLGFRYIWKAFKGWLSWKVHKKSNS